MQEKLSLLLKKKGKTIRNNDETFEGEVFFSKKLKRQKNRRCERRKKGPKQKSQPEGRTRNKKNVLFKKKERKTKQREQREK